jgi:hypothetical protein
VLVDARAVVGESYARWGFFVPVIVTNAGLFLCSFDAPSIDLRTGWLPPDAVFAPAPFVRFAKNLSVMPVGAFSGLHLSAQHRANSRTVFVVNVESLRQFLDRFSVDDLPAPLTRLVAFKR